MNFFKLNEKIEAIIISDNTEFCQAVVGNIDNLSYHIFEQPEDAFIYMTKEKDFDIVIFDKNTNVYKKLEGSNLVEFNEKLASASDGKPFIIIDSETFSKDLSSIDISNNNIETISSNINEYIDAIYSMKIQKLSDVVNAKRALNNHLPKLMDHDITDDEIKLIIDDIYRLDSDYTKEHVLRTSFYLDEFISPYADQLKEKFLSGNNDEKILKILNITEKNINNINIDDELEEYKHRVKIGMLLHDIGKSFVHEKIIDSDINKNSIKNLTDSDGNPVNFGKILGNYLDTHGYISYFMLLNNSNEIDNFLDISKELASAHHSYVYGDLKEAGIIDFGLTGASDFAAIVDIYDALLSERSYKKMKTIEQTNEIILENTSDGKISKEAYDYYEKNKGILYTKYVSAFSNYQDNEIYTSNVSDINKYLKNNPNNVER